MSPTAEQWEAAGRDASLGVRHTWYDVKCPAYRTLDPADCDCMARYNASVQPTP